MDALIAKCCEIIKCDTARISKPLDKMYFIIGFNCNTKGDSGEWVKNEKSFNFDYVAEKIVASGETDEELMESCKEYKQLCNLTWKAYFEEFSKKGKQKCGNIEL